MIITDFKCEECGTIFSATKNSTSENWSDQKNIECTKCGSIKTSIFMGSYLNIATDVGKGICGNYDNGYTKGIVYHRSTKYGKYKSKKV